MGKVHTYTTTTKWTGDQGTGTSGYRAYKRDLEMTAAGKQHVIMGSSDPNYLGDASRYNPEEMLVASLAACNMLWLLHLCSAAGIVVKEYVDESVGTLNANADGSGEFTEVVLRPRLVITDASRIADAVALADKAHAMCFIARSVNFPVRNETSVTAG